MPQDRRENVLDWRDELRRVTPRLGEMPLGARLAVMNVVAAFVREDADAAEPPREPARSAISDAA